MQTNLRIDMTNPLRIQGEPQVPIESFFHAEIHDHTNGRMYAIAIDLLNSQSQYWKKNKSHMNKAKEL